jgi:hypothetical protein
VRFFYSQELHRITIDQLHLREFYGDNTAVFERSAKDFEVFSGESSADTQNDPAFCRKPVDSARHAGAASRATGFWQAGGHETFTETGRNWPRSVDRAPLILVNVVEVVNLVNVVTCDLRVVSET